METWNHPRILLTVAHAAAEDPSPVRQVANFKVSIGDADIPAFISEGKLYVQAPLGYIWKAIAAAISREFGNMEVGISVEGRSALPLDSVGNPVSSAPMAVEGMV